MYNSAICSTDPIACFNLFGYSISHILSLILIRSVKHFVNDGENPDANLCNNHSRPMSESDPNKTAEYTSWASLTSDLDEPILRKAVQNILRVASYPWREIDTVPMSVEVPVMNLLQQVTQLCRDSTHFRQY